MMGSAVREGRRRLVAGAAIAALTLSATACSTPSTQIAGPSVAQPAAQSADGLNRALTEFSQNSSEAKILTDAQLRKTIPKAQQWLENVEIMPSKCGVTFASPIAEQLKNSVMGAVELKDQFITVAIYPDAATLKTAWDAHAAANAECSRYSVKSEGQSRAFHLAKQQVKSNAPLNEGYVVTGSDGSRTSQQLSIRSASANILIGIQQTTTKDQTAQQLNAATETINAVLDKIK